MKKGTSTGKSILNALTIIGYVCVGIYAVCAIYLIVLLAIGYFNPNSAPPTGLKFNEENQVVISENGGTASLKVLDINAVISTGENGEQIIEDNTSPTEVRLTVRDMLGNIVTNIISVPETVMSGESFDITAVTVEEEYNGQVYTNNVGGDCFLIAETTDGLYHSNPLPIFVDVPIQSFTISAVDPETQESISLEEDAFIYDDQLQLNVSVFPERALNPHTNGDTTTKEFTNLGTGNKTAKAAYIEFGGASGEDTSSATESIVAANIGVEGNPALPGTLPIVTTSTFTIADADVSNSGDQATATFRKDGKYDVTLKLANGWGSDTMTKNEYIVVVGQTSDLDGSVVENMAVYPNPFMGSVNLLFSETGNYEISVYDVQGRQVVNKMHQSIAGEIYILDVNADPGTYYIAISENGKRIKTFKVISK